MVVRLKNVIMKTSAYFLIFTAVDDGARKKHQPAMKDLLLVAKDYHGWCIIFAKQLFMVVHTLSMEIKKLLFLVYLNSRCLRLILKIFLDFIHSLSNVITRRGAYVFHALYFLLFKCSAYLRVVKITQTDNSSQF